MTVLHTPGHSPDSVSLLDEKSGWLFAGDVFNAGPVYAHFPDSDVAELAASARRLSALAGEVSLIMVHHYGRPLAEPDLLREFADGLESVETGTAELVSGHDIFGDRVLEARFDHFAVVLPGPEGAGRSLT